MRTNLATKPFAMATALILVGCATPAPVPFELIDQGAVVHRGSFQTRDQSMEAAIGGKRFSGFYLVASGTAVATTHSLFARRFGSYQSVVTVNSNAARAVLTAADGERITCEFLFEGLQAIGDCRSSANRTFQLVATGS